MSRVPLPLIARQKERWGRLEELGDVGTKHVVISSGKGGVPATILARQAGPNLRAHKVGEVGELGGRTGQQVAFELEPHVPGDDRANTTGHSQHPRLVIPHLGAIIVHLEGGAKKSHRVVPSLSGRWGHWGGWRGRRGHS